MKKNIFVDELKRRGKEDMNTYSMIGTELKRARTSQSQTLSSIAGNLCSVSYLCKVEKAQLKPNAYMLNEICKKLHVESPKINLLFELKPLLLKAVKLYYEKKWNELDEIYSQCKQFDNYRTKLIILIYYISHYELVEANQIAKELFKITSVMHNDELCIFMVFYSIIKYYEESYIETLDNIKELNAMGVEDILGKIASLVSLECYIKMNSPMTLLHSHKLLETFLSTSDFKNADYVRYLQAFYMIQNAMLDSAISELTYIQSAEYRLTLEFFIDLKNKHFKKKEYYSHLRPFGKLIYTYVFFPQNYLSLFCKLDKNLIYSCDFSYNIASYLTLSDDTERFTELTDIIIPNIKQTHNVLERVFFLKQFCRISTKFGRYKGFCKAFEDLNGGYIE